MALSPLRSVSRHLSVRVFGRKSWTTNACTGWSAPCRVGNENERVSTECGVGSWSLRMRGLSDFGVDDVVDLPGAGAPVRRLRMVVTSVVTSATHINVTRTAATTTTSQTVHESMEERDHEPSGPAAVLSLGSPPVLDEPPWPRFLAPIVLRTECCRLFFPAGLYVCDCVCVRVCVVALLTRECAVSLQYPGHAQLCPKTSTRLNCHVGRSRRMPGELEAMALRATCKSWPATPNSAMHPCSTMRVHSKRANTLQCQAQSALLDTRRRHRQASHYQRSKHGASAVQRYRCDHHPVVAVTGPGPSRGECDRARNAEGSVAHLLLDSLHGVLASQAGRAPVTEQLQLRATNHGGCTTTNSADVGITVLHDRVVCCTSAPVRVRVSRGCTSSASVRDTTVCVAIKDAVVCWRRMPFCVVQALDRCDAAGKCHGDPQL